MTERTIRIVQSCTAVEAAAMVAAIRTFEENDSRSARASIPSVTAAGATATGACRVIRKDGKGVLWTQSEKSLGRGL